MNYNNSIFENSELYDELLGKLQKDAYIAKDTSDNETLK